MKAIILRENGGPENLIPAELPVPEIKADQVLVKVRAISVNPVDASVRQSAVALQNILNPAPEEKEHIIGWDISGTIEKTGKEVTTFETGDDVFGMVNFPGNGRAYAEYVAAPASHLALKPGNVSHEDAAAASLAALTAWQALVKHARIRGGERVLIHAAAGGVGHYAVQIAKYFGAYIIGTASEANRNFLLKLGADECIDYTSGKFEEKIHDIDVVIDSVGGDHLLQSIQTLKKEGRLICLKGSITEPAEKKGREKDLFLDRILVHSNGDDMHHIAQLLEEGQLRSVISETYRFDQLREAHRQIETRKTRGKIVVVV
jgi:NADPH:quinone reductase-like Zn-dependent oxidoreductase